MNSFSIPYFAFLKIIKMKKTVIRYGLYGALLMVVLFSAVWFLFNKSSADYGRQEVLGYLTIILSLAFVFFGIKHYRDSVNNGQLTFGQGIKVGLLIVLIPSIAFGLFDVLYVSLFDPQFFENYYNYQLDEMRKSLAAREYELRKKEMESQKKMFSNPFVQFVVMFLTVFFIGLIITVISALILRRNRWMVQTIGV